MPETVTFKGKSFALKGNLVKEGAPLPDCELMDEKLQPIKLSSFKGKILFLATVPSLDTSVCSKEAARLNKEMDSFKDSVQFVTISMDLPFAQKRWCEQEKARNILTLSDFNKREAGEKLGVFIPDLGLLARAVFICDPSLIVKTVHLVKEVTEEPDYKFLLNALEQLCALNKKQ